MITELKRGTHIHFTNTKSLKYNGVLLDKVYLKGRGYFYEIIFQEIIKENEKKYSEYDLLNNFNFKREWQLYKDIDDNLIPVNFIDRKTKWLHFNKQVERTPLIKKEINDIEKKYNIRF